MSMKRDFLHRLAMASLEDLICRRDLLASIIANHDAEADDRAATIDAVPALLKDELQLLDMAGTYLYGARYTAWVPKTEKMENVDV